MKGKRSSLRLSARRIASSATKNCKRKRPLTRITSEQLSTSEFQTYVDVVWKKVPITLRYRCLCIDSLYFKEYMQRNRREKIISWMIRDGSFAQRYVFVPICQTNHWSLLIFCNFGNEFNSRARPCILLLDSLEKREEDIEPDVRKFVFAMYKRWKPESNDQDIHDIPFQKPKVPQQKDGNRCGYYVIFFIYQFLLDCVDEFNIENDYPSFMTEDWFNESDFDTFLENLLHVWQEVEFEQNQTGVQTEGKKFDTEENIMEEDTALKKGNDVNERSALVLYTPESSQEKDNIGNNINQESAIVLYTPDSSQEKNNIVHTQSAGPKATSPSSNIQGSLADEVEVKKKILKIKVKVMDVRRSPRLATPDAKRRPIELEPVSQRESERRRKILTTPKVDARVTRSTTRKRKKPEQRSTAKKGKKVEDVDYITSSDKETESEDEIKVIERSRKLVTKRKRSESNVKVNELQKEVEEIRKTKRSTVKKGKKIEVIQYITSSDAESESEEITKVKKRSEPRKRKRRDGHNDTRKRKTPKKKSAKNGKKKKKGEGEQHIQRPKKLKLRAHASTFSRAIENLSDAQKKWIKDAGFGALLSFSFRHIPNEMAANVVWFYDPYHNWLNLADKKVIRITEDEVHRVLGFPKGEKKVVFGPANGNTLKEWRDHYPEKIAPHKITELSILKAITRSKELNLLFKQNFMVLMYNLFIRCTTGSYVSQEVLKLVGSFDEVSQMNWCKLVVDGLKDASIAWLEDPTTQYYTGSLMFLIFFYLDRVENDVIRVERKDIAFTGWSNFHVLQRNQVEIVNNTYGKGVIEGYEVPEDSEVEAEDYTTEV